MVQEIPANKFLLVMQFWDGDKTAAMKAARLIADLEPEFRADVDFMFAARFDCKHDDETAAYVARKFHVERFTSRRTAKGYPIGPNELWFDIVCKLAARQAAKILPYYAAHFMEADGGPAHPLWIGMLQEQFLLTSPAFMGHWIADHYTPHMNGNLTVGSGVLHRLRKLGGSPATQPWDLFLAKYLPSWGYRHTNLIRSDHGRRTVSAEDFFEIHRSGVAYYHGVKDGSNLLHARNFFLNKVSPLDAVAVS